MNMTDPITLVISTLTSTLVVKRLFTWMHLFIPIGETLLNTTYHISRSAPTITVCNLDSYISYALTLWILKKDEVVFW